MQMPALMYARARDSLLGRTKRFLRRLGAALSLVLFS